MKARIFHFGPQWRRRREATRLHPVGLVTAGRADCAEPFSLARSLRTSGLSSSANRGSPRDRDRQRQNGRDRAPFPCRGWNDFARGHRCTHRLPGDPEEGRRRPAGSRQRHHFERPWFGDLGPPRDGDRLSRQLSLRVGKLDLQDHVRHEGVSRRNRLGTGIVWPGYPCSFLAGSYSISATLHRLPDWE